MGAKSKKERSVPASTTNYGGSTSDVGTSRATSGGTGKDDRLEQLQADHELFLQAFESMKNNFHFSLISLKRCFSPDIIVHNLIMVKIYILEPTQIYRFLRTRNMVSVSISNDIVFVGTNTYLFIFRCHSGRN